MSHMHTGNSADPGNSNDSNVDELERLLVEGVTLSQTPAAPSASPPLQREDEDAGTQGGDVQGAIGLFAEAAQDMATAGVELGLGRHFACVDYCNQVAEKAAQAVSLLRFGRMSTYDHDLGKLGALVGAPREIQDEMAILTPFHPESFYADTPPEEADGVISAEQASGYLQSARHVLRWARNIVLNP